MSGFEPYTCWIGGMCSITELEPCLIIETLIIKTSELFFTQKVKLLIGILQKVCQRQKSDPIGVNCCLKKEEDNYNNNDTYNNNDNDNADDKDDNYDDDDDKCTCQLKMFQFISFLFFLSLGN